MTALVGVVTQDPAFIGLVAALAVLIFLGTSFMLLVVAAAGDGAAVPSVEEDDPVEEPDSIEEAADRDPAEVGTALTDEPPMAAAGDAVESYAAGMASSMRGIAVAVVQRASPRAGERILDGATGAVIATSAGLLAGRSVIDVDVDRGTLAIGRKGARARTAGAEFGVFPFRSGWFQVVISVHSLQFAANPAGVLSEWRRVAGSGARLSLSVPGPPSALAMRKYDPIYRRHGAVLQVHLPTRATLLAWATAAGWQEVEAFADPNTVIRLSGPDAFHTWIQTRPFSDPDHSLSPELLDALERDLMAAVPVGPDGRLQIPFGTLYLTATNP